jgi:hypothetical protein
MSHRDFGQPADPDGSWPYITPQHIPAYADPNGTEPQPNEQWHHADAPPGDSGGRGVPQEAEPPPGKPGWGTYVPGPDEPPSREQPYPPASYRPAPHRRRRRSPGRSLAIAAVVLAAAAAAGAMYLRSEAIHLSPASNPGATATREPGAAASSRHTGKAGSASPAVQPPAITREDAARVLSRYLQVNNQANASYSDSLLHTIESGSSYAMDTGAYRFQRDNPGKAPYAPFTLARISYYIPRLPRSAYPRWFAVRGTSVSMTTGKNLGSMYIVFAQDSSRGAWKDLVEPDVLPGHAAPPQIATDRTGYAIAVSTAGNTSRLSVAPAKARQITASYLDQVAAKQNAHVLADAGNLTDLRDEVFWRSGEGGAPFTATDHHSMPADPVFGLKTVDGGALLFYTLDAHLLLTPPAGKTISRLSIPGYYSPSTSAGLTSAAVGYIEQFAAYIPPAGQSGRRIVADISSIASPG